MSAVIALSMALSAFYNVGASSPSAPQMIVHTYHVSATGSDTNNCTQISTPCKTFNKAMSLAIAGDVIHIIGTIPSIRVTKSGIVVEGGIVDGIANKTNDSPALGIAANNVTIRNIEVINGWSYGIRTYAGYDGLLLENVIIHNSVLENKLSTGGCNTSNTSGWGSGFRAYYAKNVVMRNSKIYDNCGEGFSSVMSSNVTGTGLEIYDNFSVNVYPDQSQSFTVTDSVISCVKPEYQRSGLSTSLLLGAESHSEMTTNTTDGVTFERNKIYNCKGVRAYSETTDNWKNIRIVNNEFYNVPSPAIASISGTSIITSPNVIASSTTYVTPIKTSTAVISTATNTFTPVPPTAAQTIVPPTITSTLLSPSVTPTFAPPTIMPSEPPVSSSDVIFDDKASGIIYSNDPWDNVSKPKAYGGSYKVSNQRGASVKFTFTGQSFSILYTGGPSFTKIDVYLDDVLVGTITEKMKRISFQQRWDYSGTLTSGEHTVQLVFGRGSGSFDAVIIRSTTASSLLPSSVQLSAPIVTQTSVPTSTNTALPTLETPTATQTDIPPTIVPSETPLPESPTETPTNIP